MLTMACVSSIMRARLLPAMLWAASAIWTMPIEVLITTVHYLSMY
jgi:hypothetical protein